MSSIGPSHTAAIERGSPMATKGGSSNSRAVIPAFGDDFRADARRIAERNRERRMGGACHQPPALTSSAD